ncbi:MAG: copper resistance system multicopper oxidase [Bryobacterales bacterium]|nr:copper resistance system multicopper oxidase [Bryobacterales bacterium]
MTRRTLIRYAAAGSGVAAFESLLPLWARSAEPTVDKGIQPLSGKEYDLEVAPATVAIDGRRGKAITINGKLPAPLLRWREGDEIVLRVTNHLEEDTSIHWHGILVPYQMDGVPGISFPGIKPGETFAYRFRVPQSGTYWYHSHSGLQEQLGHYGPLVIDPEGRDPIESDREYVMVLSDWTFAGPKRVFAKLKKMSDNFNFQRRTVGSFFRDASSEGLGKALDKRLMWNRMRMSPTDIADVTGAEYTYLVNGHAPAENWTALFEPGERIRLRVINASAMTLFNVRIPDLPMTVVQSDGLNVKPVETDEFQIGVAETYDLIVQPRRSEAFTLMCESIDRSGYARATLAPRAGMAGAVPPLRPRPLLTMKDMGMAHHGREGGGHLSSGIAQGPRTPHQDHEKHGGQAHDPHGGHASPGREETGPHAGHTGHQSSPGDPHAGHSMGLEGAKEAVAGVPAHDHSQGPGVQNVAMHPSRRIDEPGSGLQDVPHRTLTYSQLESLEENPDQRLPGREIELHLTSNMERYMWSFDGKKFSDIVEPIVFYKDERVRLTMINDTMMPHPIHLHGMFFDVVTGSRKHKPRKHTIIVKPAEKVSVDVTADAIGDWAFHCHLLYHMHAGMFQVVSVLEGAPKSHS